MMRMLMWKHWKFSDEEGQIEMVWSTKKKENTEICHIESRKEEEKEEEEERKEDKPKGCKCKNVRNNYRRDFGML